MSTTGPTSNDVLVRVKVLNRAQDLLDSIRDLRVKYTFEPAEENLLQELQMGLQQYLARYDPSGRVIK